jgi:hypothetical protein
MSKKERMPEKFYPIIYTTSANAGALYKYKYKGQLHNQLLYYNFHWDFIKHEWEFHVLAEIEVIRELKDPIEVLLNTVSLWGERVITEDQMRLMIIQ